MELIEAILLGVVQGLTEFLPVSSSGHLTIGKELLGIESANLSFEVTVHAATVLSTIVAFKKDIAGLISGFFRFRMNSETIYILKILVSTIPVLIVGLFFKDYVESLFGGGLIVVGVALLFTSLLLFLSSRIKPKESGITYRNAFLIGVAQSLAVIPGLSRSGSTISAGLMLGVSRENIARFSFLMVLIPILGEAFLQFVSGELSVERSGIEFSTLAAAFISAFISGLLACKTMIALVKRTKLMGFVFYCAVVGLLSIIFYYV